METINKKMEVAQLFLEVNKKLRCNMRKNCEDIGITIPQSMVIGTLIRFGEMKVTDLSKKIHLSNSTTSGIIDRLEKQKLVVRTRNEIDRRIVNVKISPKFEQIHGERIKKTEESFAQLLSRGTSEDIDRIIEGLTILNKILNEKN